MEHEDKFMFSMIISVHEFISAIMIGLLCLLQTADALYMLSSRTLDYAPNLGSLHDLLSIIYFTSEYSNIIARLFFTSV